MKIRKCKKEDKFVYYTFRGLTVYEFDIDMKQLTIGNQSHMCKFVTEDLKLMHEFIEMCKDFVNHAVGKTDLYNVEVN